MDVNTICDKLITSIITGFNEIISVRKKLTYSEDFVFDETRDIPSVAKVAEMIDAGAGSSALTFDLTSPTITDGSVSLAGLTDIDGKPMPSTGTKNSALTCFIDDDIDNSQSVSFTPSTQSVFGGFSGDETKITIIITF